MVAAGLAVYENPQVREWVDSSRRKIAVALHSLGDDINPSRSSSTPDPSTRPDESPEADDRRRKAREEILERGRIFEEKRKRERSGVTSASFDRLVNTKGVLKDEVACATATDIKHEEEGLRHRPNGFQGVENEAAVTNPFADGNEIKSPNETHLINAVDNGSTHPTAPASRERSATLPIEEPPQRPINPETTSKHPSDNLVDLTPTTSSSSRDLNSPQRQPPLQASNYWSVNEWAETASPSFYSDVSGGAEHNQSDPSIAPLHARASIPASLAGSGEDVGAESSVDGDLDVMSEFAGVSTPGTWTEVGSEVSEGDHGQ